MKGYRPLTISHIYEMSALNKAGHFLRLVADIIGPYLAVGWDYPSAAVAAGID